MAQDRARALLAAEKCQIDSRIEALRVDLGSPHFQRVPRDDQVLLLEQHRAMMVYATILARRLERPG